MPATQMQEKNIAKERKLNIFLKCKAICTKRLQLLLQYSFHSGPRFKAVHVMVGIIAVIFIATLHTITKIISYDFILPWDLKVS